VTERKIITRYVRPPIPTAEFDWAAWYDRDGEEASRYGWGENREDAIRDLKKQYEHQV
jgi:hypothetical protein